MTRSPPRAWLALALAAACLAFAGAAVGQSGADPAASPETATIPEPAAAPEPAGPAAPEPASPAAPVPSAAVPPRPDLAPIRDAVAAYRRGDIPAGDAIRAKLGGGAGALLDWAAIRLGGAAIPFDRIMAFSVAYPDFPGQAWLRRRGEDALVAERKPAATVRAYFARERPQGPAGKFALAQALRADGLPEDADALIRDAWHNDLFGPDLEARILDGFKDTLTVADHRFRMERLMLRETWEAARRASGYAGQGYDALFKVRMAVDTRSRLAPKLLDGVAAPLKADTSWLFSRVQNLRRTDKAAEAARTMADLSRDPLVLADGDAWWVERRLVSRKLLDDGDARSAYAIAAGGGPQTAERRVEAEFLAGWIALRSLKEPDTARRHFDRAAAVAGPPASQARAAYWQGRAAEAAGDAAGAASLYGAAARFGITYYGQLAAAKVGRDPVIAPPGDPESEARRKAARLPLVEAVALAYAAGLRDLGLPLAVEFGRASSDLPELESVAQILTENGDARALLTVGKLATSRGVRLDEAAFPVFGVPPFQPLGPGSAEPAMVSAIARQESAFDPAVGSGAGARGLMQLMPGTAQATARRAGIAYEPGRILDAVYNAQLGAAHLGDLMELWNGSLILTFASYNAGAGNAKKWIAAYGDPRDPNVDAIDWVERIPFSETRNYVQRVMENLVVYRRRFKGLQTAAASPPAAASANPTVAADARPNR